MRYIIHQSEFSQIEGYAYVTVRLGSLVLGIAPRNWKQKRAHTPYLALAIARPVHRHTPRTRFALTIAGREFGFLRHPEWRSA